MPDKVINEHYVPRRYLRHFAKDEHFFAFDKEKNEQRPGNVDDYACERYFYDVDFDAIKSDILEKDPNFEFDPEIDKALENLDVQHLEHWFGSNVETWLFDPIDKVITSFNMCNPSKLNSIDVLSESDMAHIALYMSIQVLRSKEFRESMVELYERLPLLLMKKMAKSDEERKLLEYFDLKVKNKNYKKFIHAQMLTDPEVASHLAGDFGNKIWIIGYNRTDMDLLTSDNPIVKFGHNGYLDEYKEARKEFETSEWIDVVLGAVDYNASGYRSEEEKLTMITRLLPFVEKRLNLIELAPKGTGKSYLFGNISRFGWLSSGGVMSRAKLFYDQSKRREGLIAGSDFVTLDEVQTISFTDTDEMRAALKGYLEQGNFTVGDYKGVADAGMVLCGNIRKEIMDADGYSNMFVELPEVFHESALIERFHGFIKGWNIPRMNDDLKVNGWALNSEYFCSIMHELRSDMTYRTIVDELVIVPDDADTRDTEAVKRIATAYLKLLFPHVQSAKDIKARDFRRYCLSRAIKMRDTIKYQLGLLDSEYAGKDLPVFDVREDNAE